MKVTKPRQDRRARFSFTVEYTPKFLKEAFHKLFYEKLRWSGPVLNVSPKPDLEDKGNGQATISDGPGVQGIYDRLLELYPDTEIVEEL